MELSNIQFQLHVQSLNVVPRFKNKIHLNETMLKSCSNLISQKEMSCQYEMTNACSAGDQQCNSVGVTMIVVVCAQEGHTPLWSGK